MLSLWPVLIMDVLLWVLVMPPIVVAAWFVMRLGLCVGNFVFVCKPVPIFLDTPCWLSSPSPSPNTYPNPYPNPYPYPNPHPNPHPNPYPSRTLTRCRSSSTRRGSCCRAGT